MFDIGRVGDGADGQRLAVDDIDIVGARDAAHDIDVHRAGDDVAGIGQRDRVAAGVPGSCAHSPGTLPAFPKRHNGKCLQDNAQIRAQPVERSQQMHRIGMIIKHLGANILDRRVIALVDLCKTSNSGA